MFPAGFALKLVPVIATLAPIGAATGLNPVITQLVGSARAVRKASAEKTSATPMAALRKQPGDRVLIRGAYWNTAAGARAVRGSQHVRMQRQRPIELNVFPHSWRLRAMDGSRSVRFRSCALATVSRCALIRENGFWVPA